MNFKKLSVVIPVFNEEKTLREVLKNVEAVNLPDLWTKEIIIVDDKSTDKTREILKEYENLYKITYRKENSGKADALRDGFNVCTGDYIIIQDADLEYDPEDYLKLLDPIIKGQSDVVFGSRVLGNKKVSSRFVYFYGGVFLTRVFNIFFNTKLTDFSTCYKMFDRKYLPFIQRHNAKNFIFDVVYISYELCKNAKVVEVPINYNPRSSKDGKKMNFKHGSAIFFAMCSLYFKNAFKK